jgi:hypothetical protein
MSKVVGVHGIANTFATAAQLKDSWLKALAGGIEEAGGAPVASSELDVVAYGALFRLDGVGRERVPRGIERSTDARTFKSQEEWERELLERWWIAAADLSSQNRKRGGTDDLGEDPGIEPPGLEGRARTPDFVQAALRQLTKSRFFRPIAPTVLISELRQVRLFLHEPEFKKAILERFRQKISPETSVVIGHSLGSVVAYEALCSPGEWNIKLFATLGSPLGIPNVVFEALTPKPVAGRGTRPNVTRWVNIADRGDLVALEKKLAPKFGDVEDILVYNGWKSHDVLRYLSAAETGKAVYEALRLT